MSDERADLTFLLKRHSMALLNFLLLFLQPLQSQVCKLDFGSLKFNKFAVADSKRRKISHTVCMDCENKLQCAACLKMYDKSSWSIHERKHHESRKSSLVCKTCREKGCYPQNLQTYTCQRCKQQLGGKKFDSLMLRHFEHDHRPKLVCKECTSRETSQLKELTADEVENEPKTLQMLPSLARSQMPLGSLLSWRKTLAWK